MNYPRLSAMLLAAVALCHMSAEASAAPTLEKFQGRIVSAANAQVVLKVGTEQFMFVVEDDTRVFVDGAPAELARIKPGYTARIEARRLGKVLVAKRILARSKTISRVSVVASPN